MGENTEQPAAVYKKLPDGQIEVRCSGCGALIFTAPNQRAMQFGAAEALKHRCGIRDAHIEGSPLKRWH
jgi:hypothetical protein